MLAFNKKDKTVQAPSYNLERSPYSFLFLLSLFGSGLLGLAGIAGIVVGILFWIHESEVAGFWFIIPSLMVVGLAGVILILGWLIRLQEEANRTRDAFATVISRDIQTTSQPTEQMTRDLDNIKSLLAENITLLREINENSLLDEEGRKRKIEFTAIQERKRSFAEAEGLIKNRDWVQAKTLLERLADKYPGNTEIHSEMVKLEDQRKAAFSDELLHTRKLVHDLIAISAWERAFHVAGVLVERHPDMQAAKELEAHVCSERTRFRDEQIKRMHADIQKSIGKKRWNDALQVSQQLIEKYPESVEAEALRLQIDTMQANAEIEKRQEIEEQIKDLVKRRNFIQAVELARYVIEQYPASPQALALRNQIDKLEELSKQQEKDIKL